MTPEALQALRDCIAITTAVIDGDDELLFTLIESVDDPHQVIAGLAGLCGLLGDLLAKHAEATGTDVAAEWAAEATAAELRWVGGEPS